MSHTVDNDQQQQGRSAVQKGAAVVGIVFLLVGVLGFIVPNLFGLIPSSYTVFDNLLHLALGVLSIAVAMFGRGGVPASEGAPEA